MITMPQLEISSETADALAIDVLRNSLWGIREDITSLKVKQSTTPLAPYEAQDLAQFLVWQDHFEQVLRYFLPHDEWGSI